MIYEFVDKVDVVIFVLFVDLLIIEVEKRFLFKIVESVDKIFFVINKCDLINRNELEEIVSFIKSVIRDIIKKENINIFFFLVKMVFEGKVLNSREVIRKSGIEIFEEELKWFLREEKEKV